MATAISFLLLSPVCLGISFELRNRMIKSIEEAGSCFEKLPAAQSLLQRFNQMFYNLHCQIYFMRYEPERMDMSNV